MSKITLLAVDTAKRVFHLVGIDRRGEFVYRRKVSRSRLLAVLAQVQPCRVVLEACGASHHWGRRIRELGHEVRREPRRGGGEVARRIAADAAPTRRAYPPLRQRAANPGTVGAA